MISYCHFLTNDFFAPVSNKFIQSPVDIKVNALVKLFETPVPSTVPCLELSCPSPIVHSVSVKVPDEL